MYGQVAVVDCASSVTITIGDNNILLLLLLICVELKNAD